MTSNQQDQSDVDDPHAPNEDTLMSSHSRRREIPRPSTQSEGALMRQREDAIHTSGIKREEGTMEVGAQNEPEGPINEAEPESKAPSRSQPAQEGWTSGIENVNPVGSPTPSSPTPSASGRQSPKNSGTGTATTPRRSGRRSAKSPAVMTYAERENDLALSADASMMGYGHERPSGSGRGRSGKRQPANTPSPRTEHPSAQWGGVRGSDWRDDAGWAPSGRRGRGGGSGPMNASSGDSSRCEARVSRYGTGRSLSLATEGCKFTIPFILKKGCWQSTPNPLDILILDDDTDDADSLPPGYSAATAIGACVPPDILVSSTGTALPTGGMSSTGGKAGAGGYGMQPQQGPHNTPMAVPASSATPWVIPSAFSHPSCGGGYGGYGGSMGGIGGSMGSSGGGWRSGSSQTGTGTGRGRGRGRRGGGAGGGHMPSQSGGYEHQGGHHGDPHVHGVDDHSGVAGGHGAPGSPMSQGGSSTVRTAADVCADIDTADEYQDSTMMSMAGFRRRLDLSTSCPEEWAPATKLAHYRYRGDYICNQVARRARKLGRVSCKVQQIKECLAAMGVMNAEVEALTGPCPSQDDLASIPILSPTPSGEAVSSSPGMNNTVEADLSALILETASALSARALSTGSASTVGGARAAAAAAAAANAAGAGWSVGGGQARQGMVQPSGGVMMPTGAMGLPAAPPPMQAPGHPFGGYRPPAPQLQRPSSAPPQGIDQMQAQPHQQHPQMISPQLQPPQQNQTRIPGQHLPQRPWGGGMDGFRGQESLGGIPSAGGEVNGMGIGM
eukprot:GHVN01035458.1.p1 GENE.GHVN01035458.1~~GHVN01035458.1.p1  ORF type:complete len:784 (+),score=133.56 GHVN01035458.1:2434-4785(+)